MEELLIIYLPELNLSISSTDYNDLVFPDTHLMLH
jgi:hypothetical protein